MFASPKRNHDRVAVPTCVNPVQSMTGSGTHIVTDVVGLGTNVDATNSNTDPPAVLRTKDVWKNAPFVAVDPTLVNKD